jgi:uncharacterized phage protein gp47/JayE
VPGPTYGPDGLQIQTATEVQADLSGYLQAQFGATLQSLNGNTVIGQLVSALSQVLVAHQEGIDGIYQSLHLDGAQGVNLDRLVQLIGLTRNAATATTCTVQVTNNGLIAAVLPAGTVLQHTATGALFSTTVAHNIAIGATQSVDLRANATGPLEITALSAWTFVTSFVGVAGCTVANAVGGTSGTAQESDADLRVRVLYSAHLPGKGTVQAIKAALADLDGVTYAAVYENTSDTAGITSPVSIPLLPAHSFVAVTVGGAASDIANVIYDQKPAGIQDYGSTAYTITNAEGDPVVVHYEQATAATITVQIAIPGVSASFDTAIADAIITYIGGTLSTGDTVQGLGVGDTVVLTGVACAAYDATKVNGKSTATNVTSVAIAISPGVPASSNIVLPWNQYPITSAANITITH